jgi:hypothetical protein
MSDEVGNLGATSKRLITRRATVAAALLTHEIERAGRFVTLNSACRPGGAVSPRWTRSPRSRAHAAGPRSRRRRTAVRARPGPRLQDRVQQPEDLIVAQLGRDPCDPGRELHERALPGEQGGSMMSRESWYMAALDRSARAGRCLVPKGIDMTVPAQAVCSTLEPESLPPRRRRTSAGLGPSGLRASRRPHLLYRFPGGQS